MIPSSFAEQRAIMVKSQLQTVGVSDDPVIDAFATVPREAFVPAGLQGLAYADAALELAPGRFLMAPMTLGLLLQHARPLPSDSVLLVGAATGYSAAIIAETGARVVALEEAPDLLPALRAAASGAAASFEVAEGPLAQGWPAAAPYSLIIFEGAIETIPQAFATQLAPGGRVAAVVREAGVGRIHVGPLAGGCITTPALIEVAARALPGFARAPAFAL